MKDVAESDAELDVEADHFALTTLRCKANLTQGKSFIVFDSGEVKEDKSYSNTALYTAETRTFDDLSGLLELLQETAKNPRLAIIRAKPLFDPATTSWMQKLLHDQPQFKRVADGSKEPIIDEDTGEQLIVEATFEAAKRRWLMLDIDRLDPDLWRGCDPVKHIEIIIQRWRASLPDWLGKTEMLIQLSSSHGLDLIGKEPKPKFHAFLITDRPVDAQEADLVMKLIKSDPAPARPVQHLYVADPTFFNETGEPIPDPLTCPRWFIIDGAPFAAIPRRDNPVFDDIRVSRSGGGGGFGGDGSDPVASTYHAGDVRRGWLGYLDAAGSADHSNGHFRGDFMSAAASFFWREGPDADLTEFWEQCEPLFERAAEQRGQGYADHARKSDYPDIVADIREKERQRRKGKLLEPAKMLPQLTTFAPELQYPLPPRKEARGGEGDPDWRPERRLDMRGVGAGKTEEALRGLIDMIRAIDIDDIGSGANLLAEPDAVVGDRGYILVQSIKLALELEARLLGMLGGETDIDVILWRGMEQPDPNAEPFLMCRRKADMEAALTTGGSSRDVCGVRGKGMCPHNRFAGGEVCGFQQQKALTSQVKRKPAIVILAGAYFAAHVPPKDARATISTDGEDLQLVRGGTHDVKLPEALHVILDEWRPGEVHITLDRESFCPVEDIRVAAATNIPTPDEWHKAVNVSALSTYEALLEIDPLDEGEKNALRLVGGALIAGRDGLEDWDTLDAGRFQAELSGPPSFNKIKGKKVEVLDFVLPIDTAQLALVAVRKLIIQPKDMARGFYAAETEELWEVSRDTALKRDTAGADDNLKPKDFVNLLAHNIRLMRMQVVLKALIQGLSDITKNKRKDQQIITVQAASRTFHQIYIPGYTTGMREDLTPGLRDVPIAVLDATAEPEIVKQWLGDYIFEIKDDGIAPMPEHVRVRQVEDAQMSYGYLGLSDKDQHNKWVRRMRAYIHAAAIQHHGQSNGLYDVGVVMPLSLSRRIGALPPRVCVVTWGSESGVNVMETVARGIVISRKLPSSFDLKNRAAICFGYPVEDGGFIKIFPVRLIRKNGVVYWYKSKVSEIMKHADERAEILRRQICDGSFNQGVGRFRVHRRTAATPLILDVITNHPMATVAVDDLWSEADLKRETDCDELCRVSAGIEMVGRSGSNVIMALTSGRAGDAFTSCLGELRAQHFKNAGKKPGKLGKKAHAELTAKAQVYGIKRGVDQVRTALARKASLKTECATSPIIIPFIIGNVAHSAFSDRFLPDFAVLSSLDARSAAPAEIVVAPGKRPIRVLVRLDGDDTENTRKLAEERLKQFFYFPLVSFKWETEPPELDALG